ENWSGPVVLRSALDGRVINAGVARYRDLNDKHLAPLETRPLGKEAVRLLVETNQSHIRLAEAARTRVYRGDAPAPVTRENREEEGYMAQDLTFEVGMGQTITDEKVIAFYPSRDHAVPDPG